MSNTVSVIAPTMDEAGNVPELVRRIAATGVVDEIFFVDDSKNRDTVDAIEAAQASYGNIIEVNYFWRQGKDRHGQLFGAVTDGIKKARGDLIIVMDADLQHPPETIPSILDALKKGDSNIVIASRYCGDGSSKGLDGTFRRIVSWGSTATAKTLFPMRMRGVTDPMTGFFALRKQQFEPNRLRPQGFKILLEILVTHPELSRVEVPLHFEERLAGASKTSAGIGRKFIKQLIQLRMPNPEVMRKLTFAAVGGTGLLLSFAVLWLLIDMFGVVPWVAYLIQTIVVIEYNFFLSRYLTWRDRRKDVGFWRSWVSFHGVRLLLTIPLNQALFTLFVSVMGWHYLVANTICIAVAMVINYIISDRFVFKARVVRKKDKSARTMGYGGVKASFVIPVKNNADTIRETVESIQALDWDGSKEVIIVGSHDDTTWNSIRDFIKSGLVKTYEVDVERIPGRRDANVKRNYGMQQTKGQIIGVIDSDVILPENWLKTIAAHFEDGYSAVGGPVEGLGDGFWT
ncbi:MAG: glycosyltransferase, partial [Candidatus Microsaccharimonas sp.]